MSDVQHAIKEFIATEIMDPEDAKDLTDTTALKATGILDSISTLKLVMFIEKKYDVAVEPHEMDESHMGTLKSIGEFIESKLG